MLLPRVGPVRAEAIIASRTMKGPFLSLADLQRVRGIGPVTVAEIERVSAAARRPRLALGQPVQGGDGASKSLQVLLCQVAGEAPLSVQQYGSDLWLQGDSALAGPPQLRAPVVRVGAVAREPAAGKLPHQPADRGLIEPGIPGKVGRTLLTPFEQAGEQVRLGLRDPDSGQGPVDQSVHPAVCGSEPEPDEADKKVSHGAGILRGREGRAD